MKKLFTAALLLLAVTTFAAQRTTSNPFKIGIKGGGSFSFFLGDFPIELHPQIYPGFTAGIFGNYSINEKFSIQSEILYSMKGSNFEKFSYQIGCFYPEIDIYINTNWIEIPILAMYHVNDSFKLYGGPYIGIFLDGVFSADPSQVIFDLVYEYDLDSDDLKLPDYGVVLGASYNIIDRLLIQIRWEQGIQNLASDEFINFFEDDLISIYNSSFQVQLDYIIN